jgi:hypothetical protein
MRHVYVTWTTDGPSLQRVPDELAHDVLSRLEAAAGGALVIHRQQAGSPHVRLRIDDSILETADGARGLAWPTGPCAGDVAIESSAVVDPLILLHELGHIFIGSHSPHPEDVMAPGGTFRPGRPPATFTAREVTILRANVANGCTRIESWAGL